MDTPQEQATFKDWAIVEVMGHNKYAGFVTTQAFGAAVLFRVDVPELPEGEETLGSARYAGGSYVPAGSKVMREKVPGFTKLIGAGSIYAITPCTEETAMAALRSMQQQPLRLLELPQKALPEPEGDEGEEERDYLTNSRAEDEADAGF